MKMNNYITDEYLCLLPVCEHGDSAATHGPDVSLSWQRRAVAVTTLSCRHDDADVSRCHDKTVAVDRKLTVWVRPAVDAETKLYNFILPQFSRKSTYIIYSSASGFLHPDTFFSYCSCSSVWCIIITQLFSIIILWSWTGCWHFSRRFSHSQLKTLFISK